MEKIPQQLEMIRYNDTESRACKYNFVFSNKMADWIYGAQRMKNIKHKLNTNKDG